MKEKQVVQSLTKFPDQQEIDTHHNLNVSEYLNLPSGRVFPDTQYCQKSVTITPIIQAFVQLLAQN